MTLARLSNRYLRAGVVVLFGMVAALLFPLGNTHSASAAPLNSVPAVSVTVPAGGSATLQVQGVALQPGSALPQGPLALAQQPIPSETVRTTLYYGIEWGYTQSDPQQVALALWYAQTGQWSSDSHDIAQRIADAAGSSPGAPTWLVDGRAIPGLVAAGQLSLNDLSLTPGALSPSAGSGTLVVRNTGAQDVTVHLPYGTIFAGANGSALVWATGARIQPPAEATATPAPPVATNTPQPPAASPTAPVNSKPGYTPPPAPTNTPAPPPVQKGDTATPVAQSSPPAEPPVSTPVPQGDPPAPQPTQAASNPTVKQPAGDPPQVKPGAAPAPKSEKPASSAPAQQAGTTEAPASAPAANPVESSQSGPPIPAATAGIGSAAAPPPPVQTSQPGGASAPPPQPNLTVVPTLPPGGLPVATPTSEKQGAQDVKPTETPIVKAEPPAAPTPEPTKVPEPPAPGGTDPIINGTTSPVGGDNNPVIVPIPEPGTQQANIPGTGGGPSSTPVWLALLSAVLVLGGWSLRRMANAAPEAVTVPAVTKPE